MHRPASCVVYGMPKAAKAIGAVARQVPLGKVVPEILKHCRGAHRAVKRAATPA